MPYQGPAYIPPPEYGNSRGQNWPAHMSPGQAQTGYNGQAQQYQFAAPANQLMPQFYDPPQQSQQQQQSFYQPPSAHYQRSPAQAYLSPPTPTATLPGARYSPDPLHSYQAQAPPRAYRPGYPQASAPQQQQYQYVPQPRPQQQAQRPTVQQPSTQPARHAPQSPQWPKYPRPVQTDASSSARNAHFPQQNLHQQQQQHQHRPPSQQRPPSGAGLPFALVQQPVPGSQRSQPSSGQPLPQAQNRSQPSQRAASTTSRQLPQAQQGHQQAPQIKQSFSPLPQTRPAPPVNPQGELIQAQQVRASKPVPQASPQPISQGQPRRESPPATINPSLLQRRVAHVEIPVQRVPVKASEPPMARSPKRRRSNEGQPIPVCDPPAAPQRPIEHTLPKKAPAASSPLTEVSASPVPPTTNIDYQAVLLGLSDEYIGAAYSMSASLSAADVSESDLEEYHGLLSTGMGCLDSILQNFHIADSRKEARIRLRLASLLFEETDNDAEAEEVLTKGLSVCERARLSDSKYAMHHLIARLWFKGGKSKAAIKAVENHISEVEKLNLVHWIYAFRFLRVSLGLRISNTTVETAAIVKQLSVIADTAARHSHVAVQFVAAIFEALVHLRSRTPDSIDLAQRALATARTHQLSPEMETMPQVRLLMDCVDLGCSLACFNQQHVVSNLEKMQSDMDAFAYHTAWDAHGRWFIPVWTPSAASPDIGTDSADIFRMLDSGAYALTFKWLSKTQVFTLGFLLSGLAGIHKNASHDQKSESFLQEGYKLAKTALEPLQQSMAAASFQYNHQRLTRIIIRLYVVFAACGRADWARSLKGIANIREDLVDLESEPDEGILSLTTYLEAIAKHGIGDLQDALKLYRSPALVLNLSIEPKPLVSRVNPLKVLAALNSILIMRFNDELHGAAQLLYDLKPYCLTGKSSNRSEYGMKALESVFFVLKATEPRDETTENPIIQTKAFLQSAVNAAKSAVNNQLLCIVMNVMTDSFFHNIVGDQAEKSARAGRSLAKKSQDPLWMAVSDGMYMDTLERCGKKADAEQVRFEAQEAIHRLPQSLKATLLDEEMDN